MVARTGAVPIFIQAVFLRWDEADTREAMPGCKGTVETDTRGDQYCRINNAPNTQSSPTEARAGVSAIFTRQIKADMDLFAELGLHKTNSKYKTGFMGISSGQNRLIWPGDAAWKDSLNGIPIEGRLQAFRSVYEAGQNISEVNSNSLRSVLGLRGAIDSWDYETAVTYSRNKVTTSDRGLLADAITTAYQDGGYDPFKLTNTDADVKALLTNFQRKAESKLTTADAKITNNNLFSFLGGAVGFASGLNISKEQADDTPDALISANIIENNGGTASSGSRTVKSIYAELSVPLSTQAEMQLALRHDRYSDFGGTTNPKLAIAYRPTESLLVRGSATTSFKAPMLPQLYMASTKAYSGGVADWVRCGPLGYGPGKAIPCSYYPELKIVSNPQLKPELSKNFAAGFVFEPIKNYSISLDYYKISQKDTIQTLDEQYILDHEFTDPAIRALIERDPRNPVLEAKYPGLKDGRLKRLTVPFMNVGKTETDGIDLSLKAEFSTAIGKLALQNDFNTILSLKQSFAKDQALIERTGGRWQPQWRNNFSVALSKDAWNTQMIARTSASMLDAGEVWRGTSDSIHLPTYTSVDFNVSYSGFKNLIVNLGATNAFDKMPRFSIDNDSFYDATSGRFLYASVRYTFK